MLALRPPLAFSSPSPHASRPAQNRSTIREDVHYQTLRGPPYKARSKTAPFSTNQRTPLARRGVAELGFVGKPIWGGWGRA